MPDRGQPKSRKSSRRRKSTGERNSFLGNLLDNSSSESTPRSSSRRSSRSGPARLMKSLREQPALIALIVVVAALSVGAYILVKRSVSDVPPATEAVAGAEANSQPETSSPSSPPPVAQVNPSDPVSIVTHMLLANVEGDFDRVYDFWGISPSTIATEAGFMKTTLAERTAIINDKVDKVRLSRYNYRLISKTADRADVGVFLGNQPLEVYHLRAAGGTWKIHASSLPEE